MNDFINPLLDDCFKTVFATRRNIANLAGFLKAALDLRPVIGVIICDHRMLEEAGYAHSYTLRERDSGNDEFTDLIKVHILELPKVPGEPDGTPVWPWLKYFKCRNVKEFEMLKKEHPEVSGAVTELRLHKASFRDRWRRTLELFEKDRRDALMWENEARREGREEGERKKSEEIARKLKAQGFPAAKIAELTGLSPGEVEGL
jgi:predicted transposase/invertase (TIGR01784 family)